MSIELVMPSNHLILCHPLLLCLQSFPASGAFPMSQLFASSGQSFGASASASVLLMNIQGWFSLGFHRHLSQIWRLWDRVLTWSGPGQDCLPGGQVLASSLCPRVVFPQVCVERHTVSSGASFSSYKGTNLIMEAPPSRPITCLKWDLHLQTSSPWRLRLQLRKLGNRDNQSIKHGQFRRHLLSPLTLLPLLPIQKILSVPCVPDSLVYAADITKDRKEVAFMSVDLQLPRFSSKKTSSLKPLFSDVPLADSPLYPFKKCFIYLFGCTGSLLLCMGFLQLWWTGATLQLWHVGLSLQWLLLLQSTRSQPE